MEDRVEVRTDSSLERLYREHGDRLWWAVLAFAGDREIASDAVAEAFAQALRRPGAIRSPLAWVWRAAFRIAAGELKERRRRGGLASEETYELGAAGGVLLALAQLSTRQRAAVVLHYYAGYPVKEVAAILGVSAPTASVHLHRGRNRLRELLEEEDA